MRGVFNNALLVLDCYLLQKQFVNIIFISEVTQHASCILEEHPCILNVAILLSESLASVGNRIQTTDVSVA
jgi:hypothetical protein